MSSRRTLCFALCLFASAACAHAQHPPAPDASILSAKGDSVRVRLFDAKSSQPIVKTAVELASSNGIVCIKAPCPTNGKSWKGATDASGDLVIPRAVLNTSTSLASATYNGDLVADATPAANGSWAAELMPVETGDPGPRPIKLLDASTRKPIANTAVRIESRGAGARDTAVAKSNALGYIFVPFPIVAKDAETAWVIVPGYTDTHLDFAAAHRKTYLDLASPRDDQ